MGGYTVKSVSGNPLREEKMDRRGSLQAEREAYPGGRGGWLDKGLHRKGGEEEEDRWK